MDFSLFWFDEKLLSAIGWTLAHSIWQIALVCGLLWSLLKAMPQSGAQRRYMLALSALFFILVITCWTFVVQVGYVSDRQPIASVVSAPLSTGALELDFISGDLVQQPVAIAYGIQTMEAIIPYLVNLWMLGALFYAGRLAGSVYDLQKLHKKHHEPVPEKLLKKVSSLSASLGIYQNVRVFKSTLVHGPVTYGFFKPVVLIPAALLFSISPAQLEAIITHELAHIKRNDYLVHLLQASLEVLFFFHPCFWWINRVVNEERENATDDLALTTGIRSYDLAHGLAEVANYANGPAPDMALAASGSKHKTLQRIKRILGKPDSDTNLSPLIPITMILAIIAASALVVGAEDQHLGTSEAVVLTEMQHVVSHHTPVSIAVVMMNGIQQDTVPAKPLPKAPQQEDLPVWDITPPPHLHVEVPPMPDLPPSPPLPFAGFDFPQMKIHIEADSLADMVLKLHALHGDHSPGGKKKRRALEEAMERVQTNLNVLSKDLEEKMARWQADHGDSFKKYEDEMKIREEKMKAHQQTWESSFAPKMQEFEKKMKRWEQENTPKLKEFEEKMKRWVEENEDQFQQHREKVSVLL